MTLQEAIDAEEQARKVCREAGELYRIAQKAEDAARVKVYEAGRKLREAEAVRVSVLEQSRTAPKEKPAKVDAIPKTEASKVDATKEG